MIAALARISRPAWPWLAGSALARLANLACGILLLVLPAIAITSAATGDDVPVAVLGAMLVGLALAKGAFRYLEHFLGHRAAFDLLADMRLRFFDAVMPLAADDDAGASADLTTIATRDIDRVEVFFAHTIVPAVTAVIVPVAVASAIGAGVGPLAGAVAFAAFAVGAVLVPLVGASVVRDGARETARVRADIADHLTGDVVGLAEIRTLGAERARLAALRRQGDHLTIAARRVGQAQGVRAAIGLAWPVAGAMAIIALATPDDVATHIVAAAALVGASPAAAAVEAFGRSLPHALQSARRYLGVLARTTSIADPADPLRVPPGPLGLRVSEATFAFPGAPPVLAACSVEVAPGGRLAVVGPSGSGKSTLISLLVRQRDPQSGSVELVGEQGAVDVRDVALGDLRRAITVVEQRPVLVSGTVRDNLRLGCPELDDAAAWRALEQAALADDVRAHPDGLDAPLREEGLSLSGGQRQRLSIARAMARDPRILILDEATSHQDAETQRLVRAGVEGNPDLTIVVVAHRDDAISGIERVLRLPEVRDEADGELSASP
ncbi:ABC transporter ATP-binding protein [Microbacterium sp. G2-8]|uniref:ABC transporter ATP-binding protein n=1 Tax=Microbacterium sp. G2-8 TaxID=2842454 RepID=UPI001C89931D|nr:ABC transporter ATP-binding protein [Microbacterium sp. G2-8]